MKEVIKDVLRSLENEPERWSYDKNMIEYSSYKFVLFRDDGLSIWTANEAYGLDIRPASGARIGKIYFWWTIFNGAPWQHKIYNAWKKWDKEHG